MYLDFKDLKFKKHSIAIESEQIVEQYGEEHPFAQIAKLNLNAVASFTAFPNNYALSVIRSDFSHGGKEGLYEAALVKLRITKRGKEKGVLDLEHPLMGGDPVGYLSEQGVTELLNNISALKSWTVRKGAKLKRKRFGIKRK